MVLSRDAQRVKRTVEQLLRDQSDPLRLRDHLEGIRKDPAFPGLTWFWGPELYQRNRAVFREIILSQFSTFEQGFWSGRRVTWREHAERLEAWLQAARKNRDTWISRRLLRWKFAKEPWGLDNDRWCAEMVGDYLVAQGPAAQAAVLDEYDDWFQLEEHWALELYRHNPGCSKFLLKHLPYKYSFWSGEQRKPWRDMIRAAEAANDYELAFALYRRQIDAKEWQRDVERLAEEIPAADQLNDELRRRHLEGWGLHLGDGVLSLLKRRGRDVMPYVREKLDTIIGGWNSTAPDAFLKLAETNGWWDLWTAVVRVGRDPKVFNRETIRLLDEARLGEADRIERLRGLAGVSQEWNWPGVGFACVHSLDDELATKLYRRYPDLVRGPFKPHVVPTWWQGGPRLLAAAEDAGDHDLVDLLASRYVTRAGYGYVWNKKEHDKLLEAAERLANTYQSLRDRDEAAFARRAGNVLTQIPAFAIYGYDQLLRTNSLARLLFVRSFPAYLASPAAVRDLVEGSEIHVQMLGYRVLAQDDERARSLAAETLDILWGTLLRPLHRKTRLAAFGALLSAAKHDVRSAEQVLQRAKQALRLPDKKYPKEELVGLMGQILHVRPVLRGPRERPVIYGLAEAVP